MGGEHLKRLIVTANILHLPSLNASFFPLLILSLKGVLQVALIIPAQQRRSIPPISHFTYCRHLIYFDARCTLCVITYAASAIDAVFDTTGEMDTTHIKWMKFNFCAELLAEAFITFLDMMVVGNIAYEITTFSVKAPCISSIALQKNHIFSYNLIWFINSCKLMWIEQPCR